MITYLLLNTANNKGYVGQHKGNTISTRWTKKLSGGNLHLSRAVKKYGWEVFSREVLNYCKSKEEMNNLEKIWILTLRTFDSNFGYNKTKGGDQSPMQGKSHKEVTKKIMSERRKDYYANPATLQVRKETSEKIRLYNLGKKYGESTKEKHRRRVIKIEERISNSKRVSNLLWITDGSTAKRIHKDIKVPIGWRYGRLHTTTEVKAKLSVSLKKKFKENPQLGQLYRKHFLSVAPPCL